MHDSSDDFRTLLTALRTVVSSQTDANRPGRLRQRLEAALGPEESVRLRRLVHQVVAASEENLPHDLRRITPLTPQSLQRLSQDLADARGWSPQAARRTTQLWASALGFADLAASSWPRGTDAVPGSAPPSGEATLLPPGHAAVLEPDPASPRPGPPAPRWPASPKTFARHATLLSGEPAVGATLGYAGMSLPLCVGLCVSLTVLLCLPILLVAASGVLLPILGVVGARWLMSRLGRGALVASASGLEFTPYDAALRNPLPERAFRAPWSQVEVGPGRVSALRFAGRRVQVGPRNRAFADAAAYRAKEVR